MTPGSTTTPKRNLWARGLLLAALVLGGLVVAAWLFGLFARKDPVAATNANLRGIALMEQFKYPEAEQAFAEAVRLDPDWTPARINLGIALLNQATPETLDRAREVLNEVLRREPENIHAHYCLGYIDKFQGRAAEALSHFEVVNRLDPDDPFTWLFLGQLQPPEKGAFAKECYARALKLDPYLNAARYGLAQHPLDRDPVLTRKLLDEFQLFEATKQDTHISDKYTEQGKYGLVIGRPPEKGAAEVGPLPMFAAWDGFQVRLGPATAWARPEDFGSDALRQGVRRRFGSALALLDFNRDGRPDVFLPSAVVRDKQLGDLLLRNDGQGVFTDVTAEAGLGKGASLGCSAADYDNDGATDLLLTGVGGARLFRNRGDGRFADVSAEAGLQDKDLSGVFLGSAWLDLDQDGDLDLVLAEFARSPETALSQLRGQGGGDGGFVVMLNTGEAPPVPPSEDQGGLATRFEQARPFDGLKTCGPAVGVAVGDLDGDRDVDLLFLMDGRPAFGAWNDRLLRLRPAGELGEAAAWTGALLLDVNHDHRSDLVLLSADKPPAVWLSRPATVVERLADGFKPGATNSPVLIQGQAVDLDSDGWTDVVGLTADRHPALLQNDGEGKLVKRADAFGPADTLPKESQAAACADLDGDGPPDLLLLAEGGGLEVRRNLGNANRTVYVDPTGRRRVGEGPHGVRTNAAGIGAWVVAQSGTFWAGQERGTTQAGLGQSSLPIGLGLGKNAQADVVRVRWPDGVIQAELNLVPGQVVMIREVERKTTSCPVLFAWDGTRFRYVTDMLGAGALGEQSADGSVRPPRPEESVKLEPGSLAAKDGWYRIKVAEPMDEVLYLDRVELVVVDHPADWRVYPDERFVVAGPPPTQELLFLKDVRYPVRARDHAGRDVTATLRDRDRRMVGASRFRSWLGFAEEHWAELDFGVKSSAGRDDRWVLGLHGWTDYPYPESIWAATQAGVEVMPPLLEKPTSDGKWQAWEELGFPAGLPRTMTRDVTALVGEGEGRFRIRTNMQVGWDEAFLGRLAPEDEVRSRAKIQSLGVGRADLRNKGFAKETSPDGLPPFGYDDLRTEPVPIAPWKGRLTKFGDVTELLAARDDCFVLCGPGDEVEIGFDARELPPVADGQVRSFVLKAMGYSKDTSPFTLTGGEVGPLPYHGMAKFPPPPLTGERAKVREDYERRWNTRSVGR